jgi:hypothetical protein
MLARDMVVNSGTILYSLDQPFVGCSLIYGPGGGVPRGDDDDDGGRTTELTSARPKVRTDPSERRVRFADEEAAPEPELEPRPSSFGGFFQTASLSFRLSNPLRGAPRTSPRVEEDPADEDPADEDPADEEPADEEPADEPGAPPPGDVRRTAARSGGRSGLP